MLRLRVLVVCLWPMCERVCVCAFVCAFVCEFVCVFVCVRVSGCVCVG